MDQPQRLPGTCGYNSNPNEIEELEKFKCMAHDPTLLIPSYSRSITFQDVAVPLATCPEDLYPRYEQHRTMS